MVSELTLLRGEAGCPSGSHLSPGRGSGEGRHRWIHSRPAFCPAALHRGGRGAGCYGTPVFAGHRERTMSGPIDLAFPGEPDYRDSPLLDAIRQGPSEAHSRLRDSWSVASDKALLQAATDSLPGVARGRPEEVPDALRWARRMGVITAITSMGVILTPRGLCLMATVTGSYDAQTFVSQDVPLMVAAGGPLVEYLGSTMHPRHLDLARRVISGCAPFDTLRPRKRLARILKVDDTLAESASAPQVHHSTANAALRPIAPFLSPGCQADWGRLGAKDQVRILLALPKRPTEVLPHISGTGNELWAGLMVWASRQVGGASAGVPVTPLPKGLPEIRDWPLDVTRGAFEASTLPITTVEALGELLGDITPSWASAPVLALLATRGNEAPLNAASWTRVSSRPGGSAAAAEPPVPAGADAPSVVDADAAGDDDPTQPYVNVDGVDPTVSDPWRLLEPSAGIAADAGSNAVPQGGHTPEGKSPSNPVGAAAQSNLGLPPSISLTRNHQLGNMGKTLPPHWRFRAPQVQVPGACHAGGPSHHQ